MAIEISQEEKNRIKLMIDNLVEKAKVASNEYLKLSQEQVNSIIKAMAMAGLEHHMELAKMAVEETGRGIYEDKIIKNMFATEYIYHSIKYDKTVGVISENEEEGYVEIAENCILWIEEPSITATNFLMNHPDVNLILATGGTGMVKAAYSCGKPALGVGPRKCSLLYR